MKFSYLESLTVAFFLLVPHTLAQGDTIDPDGNTIGNPVCLTDLQTNKHGRILEPPLACSSLHLEHDECFHAANVWVARHDPSQIFTSTSTNVCGHCVTNFTCAVPYTDERGNPSIEGTDDPHVYANNAISAGYIFVS